VSARGEGSHSGMGRELFALMRKQAGTAEEGACSLFAVDAVDAAAGEGAAR
jgi:phosphogluconate dehydratase